MAPLALGGTRAAFVLAALTAWKARHGMLFTYILRGMASLLYLYRLFRNTSYAAAIPSMVQPCSLKLIAWLTSDATHNLPEIKTSASEEHVLRLTVAHQVPMYRRT